SGSGPVKGFALAGSDRKFYWAECRIVGRNEVEVHSDKVPEPIAVRYAWADNPDTANLYNMEGLPACPFRTDDWPGVTQGKRRDFR
ncbi:MAG TPA: 9-O-acetylesterase, partial [Acidobacteriota bacterium]|nr:9-O-acetylesterase [Acidobacteriota bacterium]